MELACTPLDTNHTAEYLEMKIEEILAEWCIKKDKVINIVTDNGSNMVAAAQSAFPSKRTPCFSHTFNLVTSAAVHHPDVVGTTKKVQDIGKHIKKRCNHVRQA